MRNISAPVRAEHDTRIAEAARAKALEEAAQAVIAKVAERPGKGMSGTNRNYLYRAVDAIRALATTPASEPAPDVRVAITPVGRSNATHPLMQGIVVPAPDAKACARCRGDGFATCQCGGEQ